MSTVTLLAVILLIFLLNSNSSFDNNDITHIKVAGERCAFSFSSNSNRISIDDGRERKCFNVGEAGTVIFSTCCSDLDDDETDEIFVITGEDGQEYGSDFRILKLGLNGNAIHMDEAYRNDMKDLKPWKVQTCDVDGDGKPEVSVGVYKTARFHPVMAKRPFIYNLNEDGISPKWLGSRLSRPFEDYIFSDINSDGAEEIISIENLADGTKAVNSYAWKGFGFESIGESKAYGDIISIRRNETVGTGKQLIDACVITDGQERWLKLFLDGSVLSEENVE